MQEQKNVIKPPNCGQKVVQNAVFNTLATKMAQPGDEI